jgi:hypothetical protein
MEKIIRCSIIGLEADETVSVSINGCAVVFTNEAAQHDVPAVAPAPVVVAAPVVAPAVVAPPALPEQPAA